MKYYWKDGGFYVDEIHFELDPETGEYTVRAGYTEITEELYHTLLDGQAAGKRIVTGTDGLPELVDPPALSLDERKTAAVAELWSNYKQHQQKYVDAEDLTLAVVCAAKGSAKGAAVQAWVLSLWATYYQVKDVIEGAADAAALAAIDLVPEADNVPPYTIRELNEEAAAVTE